MNIYQNTGVQTAIPLSEIDSITFKLDNPGYLASIVTKLIAKNPGDIVFSGGEILNDGGSFITAKGVCWSTVPFPTTSDSKTIDGYGNSGFSSSIVGLLNNTLYYFRAYATNDAGTSYGNEFSFVFVSDFATPIYTIGNDILFDGYNYKTLVIGDQEWFAENLRTTIFANGDTILNPAIAQDTSACLSYTNDSLGLLYGKMYNWYAAVDSRNVCPAGWRIPNNNDWLQLSMYLGGDIVSGNKIKTDKDFYWQELTNSMATNISGFNGLPGGQGGGGIGYCGAWWSSTPSWGTAAYVKFIQETSPLFLSHPNFQKSSFNNIRCVKN